MNQSGIVYQARTPRAAACSPNGNGRSKEACSTTWFTSRSMAQAVDPINAACGGEVSRYVMQNQDRMRSVYSSCPFEITEPDIPSDDIGTVSTFRTTLAGARALGLGDMSTYSAALASSITFTGIGATARVSLGAFVRVKFDMPTQQALTLTLTTTGAATPFTGATPNRSIVLEVADQCRTIDVFLPWASAEETQALVYAPRVDVSVPTTKTIVVAGLPSAGGGTVSAWWVGPNSPLWGVIAGAVLNATASQEAA